MQAWVCSSVARCLFSLYRPWVLISALAPNEKQNNLAPVAENSGPSDYETDALPTVLRRRAPVPEKMTEDTRQQNTVLKPDWMNKLQSASVWSANDM